MIDRRNHFSAATKREAFERSLGHCECHMIPHVFKSFCGCPLGPGNTFYEHIDPDAISGRSDLDNCAVLVKTCWSRKTNGYDKPVISKAKRRADRHRGIKSVSNPLPCGRDDPRKRTMAGVIVDRKTGERWGGTPR